MISNFSCDFHYFSQTMPRSRERTTENGNFSEEQLKMALEDMRNGISCKTASIKHNINRTTLGRYHYESREGGDITKRQFGKNAVFTAKQEKLLAQHIIDSCNIFHGLSLQKTRELAYEYAVSIGLKVPESWETNQSAGEDWCQGFRKRNSNISLRSPEATSMARAKAFSRENVKQFFDLYKKAISRHQFPPDRIFNLDETGVTTVQNVGKVLGPKGKKQVGAITSAERGSLVTMCNTVSASGQALPPVFIFPRVNFKDYMTRGAPVGSLGLAAKSGWMNTELFPEALTHFMKYMNVTRENQALLIMDNHSSHISLEVQTLAKANGLTILTFPPHCSHRMQPLDVSVYGPFKRFYNHAVSNWMNSHQGRVVSIYEVAELAGTAFKRAMSIENITSGFNATGIYPVNDQIFTDDLFLPAEHFTETEQPHHSIPATTNLISDPSEPSTSKDMPNQSFVLRLPKPVMKQTVSRKRRQAVNLTATPTPEKPDLCSPEATCKPQRKRCRTALFHNRDDTDSEDSDDTPAESESDDEYVEMAEAEDDEQDVEEGRFVLVEFSSRKAKIAYVGKVLSKEDGEVRVEFYRNKGGETFAKPDNPDIAMVNETSVVKVLPMPTATTGTTARSMLLGTVKFPLQISSLGYEIR